MDHDHSYKLLFSHHEMMADLLQGFVTAEWVRDVDLATLEHVHSSHVSDDLREREDDIIWRVRWQDDWLYIYLLVEFQSTVYRFMAARFMTYEGLLYEGLIRSQQLTPRDFCRRSCRLCCTMAASGGRPRATSRRSWLRPQAVWWPTDRDSGICQSTSGATRKDSSPPCETSSRPCFA